MKKETVRGDEAGRGQRAAGDAGRAPLSMLDRALKQMFMIRVLVADFFLSCQTEEARLLDLATLQRLSAEHVGPGLELRIGDTAWVTEVRGEDGQLGYLIVEFQSRVDRTMPVRAMRYVNGIYHSSLGRCCGS